MKPAMDEIVGFFALLGLIVLGLVVTLSLVEWFARLIGQ